MGRVAVEQSVDLHRAVGWECAASPQFPSCTSSLSFLPSSVNPRNKSIYQVARERQQYSAQLDSFCKVQPVHSCVDLSLVWEDSALCQLFPPATR